MSGLVDTLSHELVRKALLSLGVLLALLVLRAFLVGVVRRAKWPDETDRLAWLVRIRIAFVVALMGGLVLVWATEIETVAISAVAVAAAIVIATKELILCFSGGLLRQASGSFGVGDRVEIGALRGDVVSYGMMTFTLLEIGPGHQWTGRKIVVPNALLLAQPVVNETYTEAYVLHVVSIPLPEDADWRRAEDVLLEVAHEVCAPYLDAARRHMEGIAKKHATPSPTVQPRVLVSLSEPGSLRLLVRVPVAARERSRVEQRILRGFLDRFPADAPAPDAPPSGDTGPDRET